MLYVSDAPALTPEALYEIEQSEIPQVAPANFKTGIRVVFPQGLVETATISWFTTAPPTYRQPARVRKRDLVASLAEAIKLKQGGVPL